MEIKLSQAITLMSVIRKRLLDLKQERNQLAFLYIQKGDKYELPQDRTFDQVTEELETVQNDLLQLETLIAKANTQSCIQWDGKEITIGEAIQLAKLYREQAQDYASYGSQRNNEIDRQRSLSMNTIVRVLTYDPKKYAEKSQKLLRKANKLSDLIDEANIKTFIHFPRYSVYMD